MNAACLLLKLARAHIFGLTSNGDGGKCIFFVVGWLFGVARLATVTSVVGCTRALSASQQPMRVIEERKLDVQHAALFSATAAASAAPAAAAAAASASVLARRPPP